MSHATTMVTPHCHLPGRLLNKTDLDYSVWRSGILFFHLHEIGAKGDVFMSSSILTRFQLGKADHAEKINPKMFSRKCGSSGSPKVDMIRGSVSFYLFAIRTAERKHYTDSMY